MASERRSRSGGCSAQAVCRATSLVEFGDRGADRDRVRAVYDSGMPGRDLQGAVGESGGAFVEVGFRAGEAQVGSSGGTRDVGSAEGCGARNSEAASRRCATGGAAQLQGIR